MTHWQRFPLETPQEITKWYHDRLKSMTPGSSHVLNLEGQPASRANLVTIHGRSDTEPGVDAAPATEKLLEEARNKDSIGMTDERAVLTSRTPMVEPVLLSSAIPEELSEPQRPAQISLNPEIMKRYVW